MAERMAIRVLVTNDDGVEAEGLRRLAGRVRDLGMDVVVAAPEQDTSGCGTSRAYPADGLIRTGERRLPGLDGVPVHAVAGPPSLIVIAAFEGVFGPAPDLVLSGINPGANVGPSVMHSGTVGAALTAAAYRRPAVALSIRTGTTYHWATALAALTAVLPAALVPRPHGPPPILNVNVPNVPPGALLGIRRAGLAPHPDARFTVRRIGPRLLGADHHARPAAPTPTACSSLPGDSAVLAAGYAGVTALTPITEDPGAIPGLDDVRDAFATPRVPTGEVGR
ncbi:5'/3'-nucleotidase SurE [Embleya sp. AB8]|uniref:5'/3'-nucleotidase SurE n=1 Tax=Embleya sp. AB8 TaxID=3156304 RepID=UPI003C711AF7